VAQLERELKTAPEASETAREAAERAKLLEVVAEERAQMLNEKDKQLADVREVATKYYFRIQELERALADRIRSSKNLNICTSPAFANSIALRTSSTSSPLSKASATSVVLFLEPGLRPPLPFSKGRPRVREWRCGLGFGGRFCLSLSTLYAHQTTSQIIASPRNYFGCRR
jgi:hypothetical protein